MKEGIEGTELSRDQGGHAPRPFKYINLKIVAKIFILLPSSPPPPSPHPQIKNKFRKKKSKRRKKKNFLINQTQISPLLKKLHVLIKTMCFI